jgi:hypothetical protein
LAFLEMSLVWRDLFFTTAEVNVPS